MGWARDSELGRLWEQEMGRIPSQGMSTAHKQAIFKARKNNTLGKEHQCCSKKNTTPGVLDFNQIPTSTKIRQKSRDSG